MTSTAQSSIGGADQEPSSIPSNQPTPALFKPFAKLCEAIGQSNVKSDKSALVAAYFETLSEEELPVAARCLSGRLLPGNGLRSLKITQPMIVNCLAACSGVPSSFVKERLKSIGEIGDAATELFKGGLSVPLSESLSLLSLAEVVSQISVIGGLRRKSDAITRLLRKADAVEVKYLVRLLCSDLRIGIQERDIENAVAQWAGIPFARVQSANILVGDIGETALLVKQGKIDDVRMSLFRPVNFMHAVCLNLSDDLTRTLPEQFVVEDKFDGFRAQVHIGIDMSNNGPTHGMIYEGLRIAVFSNSLQDVTADFLDLVPGLSSLLMEQAGPVDTAGAIFDGVIVPINDGKIVPYSQLERRLNLGETDIEASVGISVGFIAFDQLFADGRSLIQEDWYTRCSNMDKVRFNMTSTFRARSTITNNVREISGAIEVARARGSAGIMIKDPRSQYKPGRREKDWFKACELSSKAWKS